MQDTLLTKKRCSDGGELTQNKKAKVNIKILELLEKAAQVGDTIQFAQLLEAPMLEPIMLTGALEKAAECGHLPIVDRILDFGLYQHDWAFIRAAHGGHEEVLMRLLKKGHYPPEVLRTAMLHAAHNQKIAALEFLLKYAQESCFYFDTCVHEFYSYEASIKKMRDEAVPPFCHIINLRAYPPATKISQLNLCKAIENKVEENNSDELSVLLAQGIRPCLLDRALERALQKRNLDIILQLLHTGLIDEKWALPLLSGWGNIKIIDRCLKYNRYTPEILKESILAAVKNKKAAAVEALLYHYKQPIDFSLDAVETLAEALKNHHWNILTAAWREKLFPDQIIEWMNLETLEGFLRLGKEAQYKVVTIPEQALWLLTILNKIHEDFSAYEHLLRLSSTNGSHNHASLREKVQFIYFCMNSDQQLLTHLSFVAAFKTKESVR